MRPKKFDVSFNLNERQQTHALSVCWPRSIHYIFRRQLNWPSWDTVWYSEDVLGCMDEHCPTPVMK